MRTKVYSFRPKGRSDRYVTKTDHSRRGMGNSSASSGRSGHSRRSGGAMSNLVSDVLARFIVHGIFGTKR